MHLSKIILNLHQKVQEEMMFKKILITHAGQRLITKAHIRPLRAQVT